MLKKILKDHHLLLASKSPRRSQLLSGLDVSFEIISANVEEVWPEETPLFDIPEFLARLKASELKDQLKQNEIVLTADTAVLFENEILNKPVDRNDAFKMLSKLSGNRHIVVTGVCLTSKERSVSFNDKTEVHFTSLSDDQINYYLDHYHPYDKAGSYGAQDWIGYIAIEKLVGSYYNVMGLPVRLVYSELIKFVQK